MTGSPSIDPVLQLRRVVQELPGRRTGVLRRRSLPERPLAGVDLALRAGEVAWVVGAAESIAALIDLLAGTVPTAGAVLLTGRDVTHRRRRQRARIARQLVILGGSDGLVDLAGIDAASAAQPSVLVLDRTRVAGADADEVVASTLQARERRIAVLVLDSVLPTPASAEGAVHVLCGGRVVEVLGSGDVSEPMHPYARRLRDGVDGADEVLPGPLPAAEGGCPWRIACDLAQTKCTRELPELERPLGATHVVACHFPVIRRAPWPVVLPPVSRDDAGEQVFGDEPTAREFVDN